MCCTQCSLVIVTAAFINLYHRHSFFCCLATLFNNDDNDLCTQRQHQIKKIKQDIR